MISPAYRHAGKPAFVTNPDQFYLLENKHPAKPMAEIRGDNELLVSIGNNRYLKTRRPSVSLGAKGPRYYLARSGFTLLRKKNATYQRLGKRPVETGESVR